MPGMEWGVWRRRKGRKRRWRRWHSEEERRRDKTNCFFEVPIQVLCRGGLLVEVLVGVPSLLEVLNEVTRNFLVFFFSRILD